MAWSDLVNTLDAACLATFGTPVTFTPQDGSGAQQLSGIIQRPAIAEDYVPGSVQGTSVIRLFVRFAAITPSPRHGDTITINSIVYDVVDVNVDAEGGAVLKLRVT
ncbi:MAG TPA: hypothetical protein VE999_06680 [Gemmataceae bacterium]|nr:hypothetical protein [Bryobacteraceae bacterium]HZV04751.1 hypothetical protein [Gemmataceae bacterium]